MKSPVLGQIDDRSGCATVVLWPLVRYGSQILLAYPLVAIVGIPFKALLSWWGMSDSLSPTVSFAGFAALTYLYAGLLVGWIVGKLKPALIPTGLWTWLPPVTLLAFDVGPALFRPFFLASRYSEYVYATGSNEGLGVVFFTLPTFAAAGYSGGMLLAWAEKRSSRLRSARLRTILLATWLTTFAAAAPMMRDLESRMVQRDRDIRIAGSIGGVVITSDVNRLCGPNEAAIAVSDMVVPSGTRLQSLERGVCREGKTFGMARTVKIERVRVLEGPYKAAEGWIRSSRAWGPLPLPEGEAQH
jgi:hypothetical protein